MVKERLERKVVEQVVCPDCGKIMDYGDIDKYKRKSPADLMNMDLREFVKQNSQKTQGERIKPCYLRYLVGKLYAGKSYGNYEIGDGKRIRKVKDLYNLTKSDIYSIHYAGKKTWKVVNEMLKGSGLPLLQLPYKYTVTYPSEQKAKR